MHRLALPSTKLHRDVQASDRFQVPDYRQWLRRTENPSSGPSRCSARHSIPLPESSSSWRLGTKDYSLQQIDRATAALTVLPFPANGRRFRPTRPAGQNTWERSTLAHQNASVCVRLGLNGTGRIHIWALRQPS